MKYIILLLSLVFLNGCASLKETWHELSYDPNFVEGPDDHQPKWSSPEAQAAFAGFSQGFAEFSEEQTRQQQIQQRELIADMRRQQAEENERQLATQAAVQDALSPITGMGSVQVRGYVKSNGTYVAPHTRTRPDGIVQNNMGYR